MSTTYSAAFKNAVINLFLGKTNSQSSCRIGGLDFYAGAQAADPSVSKTLSGVGGVTILNSDWSTPAAGLTVFNGPKSSAAVATSMTVANARFMDTGAGTAIIDTSVTLSGGGGGVIVPTLTMTNGVAYQVDAMSILMPKSLGTVFFNDALRNALVTQVALSNGGVGLNPGVGDAGVVNVYSGSIPADADVSATGTLLISFTLAASGASWNAPTAGSATLVSSISGTGAATGTATYFRLVKGSYTMQGTIGTSGTDFIIDSTSIVTSNSFNLTGATVQV